MTAPAQVDRALLHTFVTGSAKLGEYPSAQWGAWDMWRRDLLAECKRRGITVALTGRIDTPVHVAVPTLLSDVAAQLGERWPDPTRTDGRSWTLGEAIEQVRLCCLALDTADNPAPAPNPTPDPGSGGAVALPGGTSQGDLRWAADLSKDDVVKAGFKDTNWNSEHGPAWPPPIDTYKGRRAIKFQLGDKGKRIEVEPNHQTFGNSGEAWFGFQFYLDSDFPLGAGSWHVIWQLHGADSISPRFVLQAHKGALTIGDNAAPTPLSKQRWYQCVVRAEFGAGRMSTWLDGVKVHDRVQVGQSNPDYYLKVGSYQDSVDRPVGAGTIYQAAHRMGTGYGAVAGVVPGKPTDPGTGGSSPGTGTGTPAQPSPPTGPDQPYRKTCSLPYGSFGVGDGGWIATQGVWGASTPQCIETVGARGFRVTRSEHDKNGVAAYPSIYSGAAWASGAAKGWKSARVRDLAALTTSARFAAPTASWRGNMAYDIWFDRDPAKHGGLEMMIWAWREGVNPAGAKVATLSAGGAVWDVWRGTVGGTPVVSYVRQQNTLVLDRLALKAFMDDAAARGMLGPDWYLTSPQIGAELWKGGAGFALLDWSFGTG